MAGFNYGRMAGTAARLLDRFNQGVITLTRSGAATPGQNPWDPPTRDDDQIFVLTATVAAVTVDQANAKYIDGTLITTADLVVTCAAPPIEPAMTDILVVGGQARTIKKVAQLPSAGVAVAFKLFIQG
ncbi:hypothetical protein GCM10011321_14680 [Youhaiella tibetensis]|uniref:Uncharacterized protein n=1 Tax=Paradevosia tibetensis TaxID=1447062 RepID=A0A5B9DN28_9HYPH|nr:hypothetical protein [Youhaiella tibetensis]QEE20416.1 hypothetical protein FNA67_09615 [Youhaiella tibetensis]GGF24365.1 hypothetical protein GCM10011321_14680 [Youhaiella tibetensis]